MEKIDLPNFAAWSNENLANFAIESYIRMQEQHDAIQNLKHDLNFAMSEIRKHIISTQNKA
jgi:hypothetical protein